MRTEYNLEIFSQHGLSESQIHSEIQDGILLTNPKHLFMSYKIDGYYHIKPYSFFDLQIKGIKKHLVSEWSLEHSPYFGYTSFWITDFHLICVNGTKLGTDIVIRTDNNWERVYKEPHTINVIPLEKIEYIKFEFSGDYSGYMPARTMDVKQNPVAGAVVGAVIAGAPGAVVGAITNSGTKTKTLSPAHHFATSYYDLKIKLKDVSEEYIYRDFWKVDGLKVLNAFDNDNREIELLIKQATTNITLTERKKIIKQSVSKGEKDKINETIVSIIVGIILFAIVFAFWEFC